MFFVVHPVAGVGGVIGNGRVQGMQGISAQGYIRLILSNVRFAIFFLSEPKL